MPETYPTRSATRAGTSSRAPLVADNEVLVLQRLREQGYTPLEVGKQKQGLNIEITSARRSS